MSREHFFPIHTLSPDLPIPPHAQLVFQGKIFQVWQWEQKMFDASMETFERLKRPNTAQVIPIIDDKILIQTEEQPDKLKPFISLPGGRCDWDEDPLDAAKRELLQETGYTSSDWVLCKEQALVGRIEWTVYTYIARNCILKRSPQLDAGEKITPRLISLEEFLMLPEDPSFYERELVALLLYARFDSKIKEEFSNLLFGKK